MQVYNVGIPKDEGGTFTDAVTSQKQGNNSQIKSRVKSTART